MKGRLFLALLVGAAGTKVAAALAGLAVGPSAPLPPSQVPFAFPMVAMVVFAAVGSVLLVVGRGDLRAVYLGAAYLSFATAFSNRPVLWLAESLPAPAAEGALLLLHTETDALFPLLFWLFLAGFPRGWAPRGIRATVRTGIVVAGTVGVALAATNLLVGIERLGGGPAPFLGPLTPLVRDAEGSLFYPLILGLTIAGVAFLGLRLTTTGPVERRRVRLFLAGLLAGFGPPVLAVLVELLVPAVHRFLGERPGLHEVWAMGFLLPCLLSAPVTTAYAVLRHRVLDVRLVARRALQYGLARSAVAVLVALPLTALVLFLWSHRHRTLADLFSGGSLLTLAAATALALLVARHRRALLQAVDRRFFREHHDAWRILELLREQIRWTGSEDDLGDLVTAGIDRALHPERVALLLERPESGALVDPRGRVRPLDGSSALVTLLSAATEPFEVDLEARPSPASRLPEGNRHWLVDSGAELMVPMAGSDGVLLGALVLGPKRSGLPYLREDRALLATVADAAAATIELLRARARRGGGGRSARALLPTAETARECRACGRIYLPRAASCTTCDELLEEAAVPYVLPGKFRFEERLGAGGMGVVYRAADLALGRPVAVKTLRRVSPEDAMRLRREARTAAAVSHPNLAAVYGIETWRGMPMLILEYLQGGTLAERLEGGPLEPLEAAELGTVLAGAVDRLHSFDVLHRDVKPSNIGFDADGTAKLTDFGIARLHLDFRGDAGGSSDTVDLDAELPPTSVWREPPGDRPPPRRMVGTLGYLAPEIVDGEPPGKSLDLWGLAMVLYEAVAGCRVFSDREPEAVLERIRTARIPPLTEHRPDCPQVLARLLERALDRDPAARFASAGELRSALEEVTEELRAARRAARRAKPDRD